MHFARPSIQVSAPLWLRNMPLFGFFRRSNNQSHQYAPSAPDNFCFASLKTQKLAAVLRRYVGSAFGLKYFKNVGFSVAGNPALSISSNSYAGAFVSGAFVGIGV